MAAFVIVLAYCYSELNEDETSRYLTIARLLLEYPRWRWGNGIHESIRTVVNICTLTGLNLRSHAKVLIPEASAEFLFTLQDSTAYREAPQSAEASEVHCETSLIPSKFDPLDTLSTTDNSTFDPFLPFEQPIFSFWDFIECPVEAPA